MNIADSITREVVFTDYDAPDWSRCWSVYDDDALAPAGSGG